MGVLLLIIGILLFIGLVVVHEFGHFIMARRNGVGVEEFGIGFPPAFYRKRIKSPKGDYDFTLNLLPLGGFVRLKGEHDSASEAGTFGAASTWAKTKIMAAGVVMNFIVAFILFTIVALIGMPKLVENQFTVSSDTKTASSYLFAGYVEPNSPASKAGLEPGDRIEQLSNRESGIVRLDSTSTLPDITKRYAGEEVRITFYRGGEKIEAAATFRSEKTVSESRKTKEPKGYLGVASKGFSTQRSTWSAPVVAAGVMAQFTDLTFEGLGRALSGLGGIVAGAATGNTPARQNAQTEASNQVSGPLGIFFILKDGTLLGFQYILFIIAIISLTLAIMNILPIPALDGGRLWLTLLFRALRRPLSQRTEEIVNATGFFILMGLIVLITFVDVKRFL